MSFDLRSENGAQLTLSSAAWALYLNLAEAYGWKRQGTQLSAGTGREWDGHYDSNDGQHVSREDAAALASALGEALRAPDLAARERAVADAMVRPLMEAFLAETGEELPAEEAREGLESNREQMSKLIDFLRSGGFTIR